MTEPTDDESSESVTLSCAMYADLSARAADGDLLRAAAAAWAADGRNLRADLRRVIASYQATHGPGTDSPQLR